MRECELLSLRRREKREHRRAKYKRNRESVSVSVSVSGHMRPNRSECYVYSVVICMGRRCEWDLPRRKEFCEFFTPLLNSAWACPIYGCYSVNSAGRLEGFVWVPEKRASLVHKKESRIVTALVQRDRKSVV